MLSRSILDFSSLSKIYAKIEEMMVQRLLGIKATLASAYDHMQGYDSSRREVDGSH